MKKQKIFINGEIKETELDAPSMRTVEEKMRRIKPYFSCLNITKSSLEDTKFTKINSKEAPTFMCGEELLK